MKVKSSLLLNRRVLVGGVLLLLLAFVLGLGLSVMRDCWRLYCILHAGSRIAQCTDGARGSTPAALPTSDSGDLIIEKLEVTRDQSWAVVSVKLGGRFWNETDQNLYIFAGQPPPDGAPATYSLSTDEQYFADIPYSIRNSIQLPHGNDLRVGVMSPQEYDYTPQVYLNDPVRADLVGRDAHVEMSINGQEVRLRLPLAEYYERKRARLPGLLSFTVATARDYVGFVDQVSVNNVPANGGGTGDKRPLPPAVYPSLDFHSHVIKDVILRRQDDGSVQIELETAAPINDWAQTNLYFFFMPSPSGREPAPADPSQSLTLPHPWSYYCGVYSSNLLFCKPSKGSDYSYDLGYAERSRLEKPAGVVFRELGGAKYVLELSSEILEEVKSGGDDFALMLTVGRDGFGPTSCYGCHCSGRCEFARMLRNYFR